MRITHRAVTQTALLGLNDNLSSVARLQQQLTSGKLISAPSDSPTGTNKALQIRQDHSAVQQYAKNVSDGQSWLDATDTALNEAIAQVQRVRALTVQAMNQGAASTSSQKASRVSALTEKPRCSRRSTSGRCTPGRARRATSGPATARASP